MERQSLNFNNWPQLILPVIPVSALAYLVRKPNTVILRLLLFPLALLTSLRVVFNFFLPGSEYTAYNFVKGKPLAKYIHLQPFVNCVLP